jgi:hypothetical protein
MKRLGAILIVLVAGLALSFSAWAEIKKAKGSIELSDAAGDSKGEFDVVKLSIASDGKQLKFDVTLREPPGNFADSVIAVYFDTDNDPQTGAKMYFLDDKKGFGYEYTAKLNACIKYDNGMTACAGGSDAKVLKRFGAMALYRYKGKTESGKEEIVARIGGKKKAKRIPIKGKVVQGVLDYEDLKAKSGQTIRILIWEANLHDKNKALFPEVLLTLK